MSASNKEVVLSQVCPGCALEGKENFLRNQLGVFGHYCTDDRNNRVHVYNDTDELREEVLRMKKAKRLSEKFPEKPEPKPKPRKETGETEEDAKLSAVESTVMSLTETDMYRLSDLLGQAVTSAGDLIGAVYNLRTDVSSLRGESERRQLAVVATDSDIAIPQRADGGLTLQVYVPEPQAKLMTERAVFNNASLSVYAQGLLEYQMSFGFFPTDVPAFGGALTYDGVWVALNVPEPYVGTMIDKAASLNMSPAEYLQNYMYDLIRLELFP